MPLVILDLSGDPSWSENARQQGARYVSLADPDLFVAEPGATVVLVDSRNRYEEGLELIARLAASSPRECKRVLVTERESAREHERAFIAGSSRVVLMEPGEGGHAALLADLASTLGGR